MVFFICDASGVGHTGRPKQIVDHHPMSTRPPKRLHPDGQACLIWVSPLEMPSPQGFMWWDRMMDDQVSHHALKTYQGIYMAILDTKCGP
jgi:hypothetical protein